MPENKKVPAHDDFVSKVVKDPRQPPDAQLITGFVGRSSEDGHTRFYTDANLRDFVDTPDEAILHSEKIASEHSPLGGSHVWIDRNAEVIDGTVGPRKLRECCRNGIMSGALRDLFCKFMIKALASTYSIPEESPENKPGTQGNWRLKSTVRVIPRGLLQRSRKCFPIVWRSLVMRSNPRSILFVKPK